MEDRSQFVEPDWDAPLDVDAYLAAVPRAAMTKGMFFARILDDYRERYLKPPTRERYVGFKDYPLREWMELAVAATRDLWPQKPPREALRRIGHHGYTTFIQSFVGRVLFGVLGSNLESIMRISPKGYALAWNLMRADAVEVRPGSAILHLWQVYDFVDCYHGGLLEGVLRACNRSGRVRVRPVSLSEAYYLVDWW